MVEIKQIKSKEIIVDAANKVLGRVATEVVQYLQGKNEPNFVPYKDNESVLVLVKNANKIKITGKKMEQKIYWKYSGYPGGIYGRKLKDIYAKDSTLPLRLAVYGMLAPNRLRAKRMWRLKIEA